MEDKNLKLKLKGHHKKQNRTFDIYGFDKHSVYEDSPNDYKDTVHSIDDVILYVFLGLKNELGQDVYIEFEY